jgi:hypothetical protein
MSIDIESGPAREEPYRNPSGAEEISVIDERQVAEEVKEILEHQRRNLGKLVGLVGLPRHGKTEFAKQARDNRKFGREDITEYAVGKTHSAMLNIYFLPGRERRDVLIDFAGEDFQDFGRYTSGLPEVMKRFLWPIIPTLDGLVVFVALPYLWNAWNLSDENGKLVNPSEQQVRITEDTTAEMINSITVLLKYALVARQLGRVRKTQPNLKLTQPKGYKGFWAPDRHTIDEAFRMVNPLDIPVFIAFSKADLCQTPAHPVGLRTPPLPANGNARYHAHIQPETSDPLILGMQAFPRLHEFLSRYVRYFKYDFVQVLRDHTIDPNPLEAPLIREGGAVDLRGVESVLEFVTDHPWRFGSPGVAKAVEWSRRADPDRWTYDGMQKALGGTSSAAIPAFVDIPAPPVPPVTEPLRFLSAPVPAPYASPSTTEGEPGDEFADFDKDL